MIKSAFIDYIDILLLHWREKGCQTFLRGWLRQFAVPMKDASHNISMVMCPIVVEEDCAHAIGPVVLEFTLFQSAIDALTVKVLRSFEKNVPWP